MKKDQNLTFARFWWMQPLGSFHKGFASHLQFQSPSSHSSSLLYGPPALSCLQQGSPRTQHAPATAPCGFLGMGYTRGCEAAATLPLCPSAPSQDSVNTALLQIPLTCSPGPAFLFCSILSPSTQPGAALN